MYRVRIKESEQRSAVIAESSVPDPDVFWSEVRIWLRILPFSHKSVERTEIIVAKKILTQKFSS
jgi:hypothetical protein